ncbi:MAG: PD-(D/E)XK nuclease family protein [Bacteroidota bacterium]|nr:PD-(D/E)XK nuclease family protein [Bacteroidota bacterium]
MLSFLEQILKWLLDKNTKDFSKLTIVFPNKRAGLFFRNYLSKKVEKTIWSPKIFDIKTFVLSLSDLQLADNYSLIFDLYEIYDNILQNNNLPPEEFDKFYPWGKRLIKDFNDVDKNLVNATDLFKNVKNLKDIDNYYNYLTENQIEAIRTFWEDINISKESYHKERFIKLWEVLNEIYEKFGEKLLKEKLAYEGMIYRNVVEKTKENNAFKEIENIVFAGFNILTKAEEEIFTFFKKENKATYFWDFDEYFLKKENFKTGEIIRKNIKKFPSPANFKLEDINLKNKNVEIISVALQVGQAKAVGDKLKSYLSKANNKIEINETAIILPAEQMLFPMLGSLPESVEDVNITMGYPLKETQLSSLIELLADLQQNSKNNNSESYFYFKNVISILKHPYINSLNKDEIDNKINEIKKRNLIYISSLQLDKLFGFANIVFTKNKNTDELFNYFIELLKEIYSKFSKDKDEYSFENEFIFEFYKAIKRFKEIVNKKKVFISEKIFFSLIKEIISSITIPFTGEPLKGLQIMGTLETRCLDFKNIFILSMNEGKWPASTHESSFIPYNLRRAFDLPTNDIDDISYSYYFYRLLQRAENIHIFYNSEMELEKEGELSRYINQLKYDSDFNINELTLSHKVKPEPKKRLLVSKNDNIEQKLSRYLSSSEGNKSLSPSAINSYIDCPLKFYFKYVADLYENDEVEESVDQRIFGNIIHKAMELIYTELSVSNKIIEAKDLNISPQKVDKFITTAFTDHYKLKNKEFSFKGENIIIKEVLKSYINQILRFDKKYAPFEILSVEDSNKKYNINFDIELENKANKVRLKGIIDRVDKKGNVIRVIDYKSGKDEIHFQNIESLFDAENPKRNKAAMQTLFYGMLYYEKTNNKNEAIQSAVFSVKNMFNKYFDPVISFKEKRKPKERINDIKPLLEEFKENLKITLEEIFDSENDFVQTENEEKCKYCPYTGICDRDGEVDF